MHHLPLIDFTNWKKGENVVTYFIDKPAQKQVMFVYQNKIDGSKMELSQDELMNNDDNFYNNYDYVDRKDKIIKPLVRAKIDGFTMLDESGADHAYDLLNPDNKENVYILFMSDLDETNVKGLNKVKTLAADCAKHKITFVAVTNTPEKEIKSFIKEHKLDFPVYCNPIDPVKGPFMVRDAVRSNPGLILIRQGIVIDKWAWRDFPETAETNK